MAKKSSSAKRVTNTVNNKSSRPKAKGQSLPLNNTNSNKRGSKKYVEESEQDSEKDSDVEEDFIALSSKKSKQEDSEEDEEVFNLRGDDSDEVG